jgi:hypothetical protein
MCKQLSITYFAFDMSVLQLQEEKMIAEHIEDVRICGIGSK